MNAMRSLPAGDALRRGRPSDPIAYVIDNVGDKKNASWLYTRRAPAATNCRQMRQPGR